MNLELFIAKRIIGTKSYKSSVSAPIIKIGITAIAIGVVVMLIAISTGLGLQQKIREKVVAFNGHIIIANYDNNASNESLRPISKKHDFYPKFSQVSEVEHIQAVVHKFTVIRTPIDFEGVIVKGVSSDYNWNYLKDFLVAGSIPQYGDDYSNDILISQYLADRLQFKVGDSFQAVFGEDVNKAPRIIKYDIIGIFNSGFQELDQTFIIGHIKHLQRLNKWADNEIGHFEVFVKDFKNLDETAIQIYQNTPSLLNATKVTTKYATIFEWIKIFDSNTYGIIGIMILVAGINMITALLVLILERTQMIGILKALGSSNKNIQKIFLFNAAYLIGIGLFWGNLIGLALLFAQQQFKLFPLDPSIYYVTEAPVYINLNYIVVLNIGTFVICLLMLLIPSAIISKISAVKAIRFQ
ncbi:ABC transporter permease [Paucihalobacter ruber]|uniref:ABC transporter permease n=1 Tax=Paucihalobacter ruber TaxID=2567861 RepID=A0A506PQL2_9FLAO|nr:FtsX-like permease family protein [Paucihalobacter ruber]TPV35532.1 ABC transporter permease [Paucihalobacter ruber]